MSLLICIDNGVTGSMATYDSELFEIKNYKLPLKMARQNTYKKKFSKVLDREKFSQMLVEIKRGQTNIVAIYEKHAMLANSFTVESAVNCEVVMRICLEDADIQNFFVCSAEWQKILFPNIKGRKQLKIASFNFVKQTYPKLKILKPETDSVCMAHVFGVINIKPRIIEILNQEMMGCL